ncbi:hypothetical protein [Rhizobium grahamii]|uniref:Transmembrane protein n=1 Tax=Rhizobium grahamii CCGE 502 TaxID=990285 RepID=S3HA76_9HYPH|nr:hypothetical protein [Rhizobium grahamii]EPE95737.1 hypothetical protein RGCCGE502_22845 [Rhizobium grahamii CCGE 502]
MTATTAILAGVGAAFCAGMLFGTALLVGKLPRAVLRLIEWRRLRSLRVDDTWENSPWRDM